MGKDQQQPSVGSTETTPTVNPATHATETEVAAEDLAAPSPETVAALQEAGGNSLAADVAAGQASGGEEAGQQAEAGEQAPVQEVAGGQAAYEAALGKFLGGKLYAAVHDALSFEAMQGYARDGMASGLKALADLLNRADEVDPKAVDQFAEALVKKYGDLAAQWLDSPGGHSLQESLQGWADAHPRTIVALALLAAAGAVLADMDIPELKHTLELGEDTSLTLAARLGSLRNIAVQKISAKLQTVAAGITATLSAEVTDGDDGVGGKAGLTLEKGGSSLTVDGEIQGQDLTFGVSGETPIGAGLTLRGALEGDDAGVNSISAAVETERGDTVNTTEVSYDLGSETLTLSNAAEFALGPGTGSVNLSADSAGNATVGVGYEGDVPGVEGLSGSVSLENAMAGLGVGSSYDLTAEQRAALGLDYTKDDFEAHFQLDYDSTGSTDVSTEVAGSVGENQRAGFRATLPNLDPRLLEVGGFYQFESPDRFQGFLADYTYNRGEDSHELKLRVEEELGGIYWRLSNETVLNDEGVANRAELLGAKFVDSDVALIGGVRDNLSASGDHSVEAVVGAQVQGVPITIGYDPSSGAVSVGLTLRFGR